MTFSAPFVGGPYADFVHVYGQPFGQAVGNRDNFYADSNHEIILNVDNNSNGIVYNVNISGPTDWDLSTTMMYCEQFLPVGATEYNSTGQNTDYMSDVGEVVIENLGSGTCILSN